MSTTPIDYTALAKQAGAVDSQPAPSQGASVDYTALAKQAGAIDSQPAPGTTGVSGFLNKVGEGGAEAAGDIWGAVKSLATTPPPGSPLQIVDQVKQVLPLINSYEKARSGGASIVDSLKAVNDTAVQHVRNIASVKPVVDAFHANPTRETARALVDTVALAASMFAGGGEAAAPEAEAAAAPEAAAAAQPESMWARLNPFRAKQTAQEIIQGKGIAQAPAQAAVRGVAGAADTTPLMQGAKTVISPMLDDLESAKVSAYKQIDKEAGFDVKAAKDELKNDQWKLKQLLPTDTVNQAKLKAGIEENTLRIQHAEQNLTAKGIDPKGGDKLNTSWKAGQQVNQSFRRALTADGKALDVDKFANQMKNLRDVKFGDRLAQWLGKGDATAGEPLADAFMKNLTDAQAAGAHAVKVQTITKWLAGAVGVGAAEQGIQHGIAALSAKP